MNVDEEVPTQLEKKDPEVRTRFLYGVTSESRMGHMYNDSQFMKFSHIITIPTFSYSLQNMQYIRYFKFICALICLSKRVPFLWHFPTHFCFYL